MLDLDVGSLIKTLRPYVTDAIWLGRANRLRQIIAVIAAAGPNKKVEQPVADPVVAFESAASNVLDVFTGLHHSQPVNDDGILPHRKTVRDALLPIIRQMVACGYFVPDEFISQNENKIWSLGLPTKGGAQ